MQSALVTMMIALLNAMAAKYTQSIEIHNEENLAEREHVAIMFHLFSVYWIIATSLNFVMASDPYMLSETTNNVRDFGIGAILGVTCVILLEFARGFFIPAQNESDFLRVLAFSLNVLGFVSWTVVIIITTLIVMELRKIRSND